MIHSILTKRYEWKRDLYYKGIFYNIVINSYNNDHIGDSLLTDSYQNMKNAIKTMTEKFAWTQTPDGFEFRDSFRYNEREQEFLFDSHLITYDHGSYVASDNVGKRFIRNHLQLFDTLETAQDLIQEQYEVYKEEIDKLSGSYTNPRRDLIKRELVNIHDEVKAVRSISEYGYYGEHVASYWLNALNNSDKTIDELASEFMNMFPEIKKYFNDFYVIDADNKILMYLTRLSIVLSLYHPRGIAFSKKILELSGLSNSFYYDIKNYKNYIKYNNYKNYIK